MTRPPLNGTKTHPLTPHALRVLRSLLNGPRPRLEVNAGVVNRFAREELVEEVEQTSPYAIHKGGKTAFLRITEAGRAALWAADQKGK
jgi:hypothetical protein